MAWDRAFQSEVKYLQEIYRRRQVEGWPRRALCNHLVAVLYQTAHYRAMGFKSVPVPLSCTSTLQRWHRPRTQGIAPESTTNMVVKKSTKTTTKFVKSIVYKAYSGPLPDPHIMSSMKKLENSVLQAQLTGPLQWRND
uniref:Uncharacterized protein n=1 Tax=Knipowitschia caucasica TaxID=637954 RepID=A0AAV2JQ87_KNICA